MFCFIRTPEMRKSNTNVSKIIENVKTLFTLLLSSGKFVALKLFVAELIII